MLPSQNIKDLIAQLSNYKTWVPPGHFYSPIPSLDDIKKREHILFNRDKTAKDILGVDFNVDEQLNLLKQFGELYKDLPFESQKHGSLRYFFENPAYSYGDAICLYSMIRYLRPKKIIEIGSGYSSCVTLDTNEIFFDNELDLIFIEPYPELFISLLKPGDLDRVKLLKVPLQDINVDLFANLDAGDILFVDSTHVSKIGSDVNYIFFEILPRLKKGVYIHFHDVFFPFEYPQEWIYEGRSWNEDYMLRAFLQYNNAFKIVFFNNFLWKFHRDLMIEKIPLCERNPGGSLWITNLAP